MLKFIRIAKSKGSAYRARYEAREEPHLNFLRLSMQLNLFPSFLKNKKIVFKYMSDFFLAAHRRRRCLTSNDSFSRCSSKSNY